MSSPEDPIKKEEKTTYVYLREDNHVVTHRARTVLIILIALLFLSLLWAFFGSIPITIDGKGIVVNEKGLLYNLVAKQDGIIRKVVVNAGDHVKTGDTLVEMFDPSAELRYKNAVEYEKKIQEQYQAIKDKTDATDKANVKEIQTQIESQKGTIQAAIEDIAKAKRDIPLKQEMLARGLIKVDDLNALDVKIQGNTKKISTANMAIAKFEKLLLKPLQNKDLMAKEKELAAATADRKSLEFYQALYKVIAPNNGTILEVMVDQGDQVKSGTPVVWMEYADKNATGEYLIKAYFPVERGKSLAPGMTVEVEMSTVDPKEYGYLKATVKSVSQFAVSREKIAKTIHNDDLVKHLTNDYMPTIEATIEPVVNPSDSKEYMWTSGRTPSQPITSGTICNVTATVATIRPVYYVLPLGKFKMVTPDGQLASAQR